MAQVDKFQINTGRKVFCPYDSERYALRASDVDVGDIVYVNDTGSWYFVLDTDNLNNSAGYDTISSGAAAGVTSVAGLTGAVTAPDLRAALGLATTDDPVFNSVRVNQGNAVDSNKGVWLGTDLKLYRSTASATLRSTGASLGWLMAADVPAAGSKVWAQFILSGVQEWSMGTRYGSANFVLQPFNSLLGADTFTFTDSGGFIATGTIRPKAATSITTSSAGEFGFDTNSWAAGRGAMQVFDGTANTLLVGVLASDTPSNGQVPTWNTGGTITWETPSSGGVTSITGTSGQITASAATGAVTLSIPSALTGISSVTPTSGNLTLGGDQIIVPNGANNTPGIAFAGLTSAGMWYDGAPDFSVNFGNVNNYVKVNASTGALTPSGDNSPARTIGTSGVRWYGAFFGDGGVKTGNPSGGTAAAWLLGDYTIGAPTPDGYLLVQVGADTYKIAVDKV